MKKSKITKELKQYGFWAHDIYPYVLYSIGVMQDDGWFKADDYGGAKFLPVKVLNLEEGYKVTLALAALVIEYKATRQSLHRGFVSRAAALAQWLPLKVQGLTGKEVARPGA